MRRTVWTFMIAACMLALRARDGAAQDPTPPTPPTKKTSAGVFTADQATKGQDIFGAQCQSCHTREDYTGPEFSKWDTRPLWELFDLVRTTMPKDNPNTLTADEYAQVISYILKLNGAPAGNDPMPTDSVALKAITIELKKNP